MPNNRRRFSFANLLNQMIRVFAVALLAVTARVAGAQMTQMAEGSRVQISTETAKKVTGIVRTVTADSTSIFLQDGGGTRRFANADVTELRVSRGRKISEGVKKGALWGTAIGAALGLAVITSDGTNNDSYYASTNGAIMSGMVFGGLFWGVVAGAIARSEQWDKVTIHPRPTSSSGGMGLSFSLSPAFLH